MTDPRKATIQELRRLLAIPDGVSAGEYCTRIDGKVRHGWRIVVVNLETADTSTKWVPDPKVTS